MHFAFVRTSFLLSLQQHKAFPDKRKSEKKRIMFRIGSHDATRPRSALNLLTMMADFGVPDRQSRFPEGHIDESG